MDFVANLGRPGGTYGACRLLLPELSGKRLELLKEIVPGIVTRNRSPQPGQSKRRRSSVEGDGKLAARVRYAPGLQLLRYLEVRHPDELDKRHSYLQ